MTYRHVIITSQAFTMAMDVENALGDGDGDGDDGEKIRERRDTEREEVPRMKRGFRYVPLWRNRSRRT